MQIFYSEMPDVLPHIFGKIPFATYEAVALYFRNNTDMEIFELYVKNPTGAEPSAKLMPISGEFKVDANSLENCITLHNFAFIGCVRLQVYEYILKLSTTHVNVREISTSDADKYTLLSGPNAAHFATLLQLSERQNVLKDRLDKLDTNWMDALICFK